MQHVESQDGLAHILVPDDLYLRPEDGIAVGVIVMKMRVHDPADGLIAEEPDVLNQRSRYSGRGPRIHQHHVVIVHDHHVVAAGNHRAARRRVINAVGDLLEIESFAFGYWPRCIRNTRVALRPPKNRKKAVGREQEWDMDSGYSHSRPPPARFTTAQTKEPGLQFIGPAL